MFYTTMGSIQPWNYYRYPLVQPDTDIFYHTGQYDQLRQYKTKMSIKVKMEPFGPV